MPRDQPKEQTVPFDIRVGSPLVGPVLAGMRREGNPGSIPLKQHHHLQNAVLTGGDIECRGGQEATGDVVSGQVCADGGSVPGITNVPSDGLISLIVQPDTDGVFYYNEDLDPSGYGLDLSAFVVPSKIKPAAANPRHSLIVHEEEPYFYGGPDFLLFLLSIPTDGIAPPTERAYTPVGSIGTDVTDVITAFGEIWFSFWGGQVRSFSIATGALTNRGSTGLTDPVILAKHRETIYACGFQELKRWDGGTTWTSVSSLTDTTYFSPRCMRSLQDVLYIGGQEVGIIYPPSATVNTHAWWYEFDGTTATGHLLNTVDDPSAGDPGGVIDFCEYNTEVVFAWNYSLEDDTRTGRIQNIAGDYIRIGGGTIGNAVIGRLIEAGGLLYISAGNLLTGPAPRLSPCLLKVDESAGVIGAGTVYYESNAVRNGVSKVADLATSLGYASDGDTLV